MLDTNPLIEAHRANAEALEQLLIQAYEVGGIVLVVILAGLAIKTIIWTACDLAMSTDHYSHHSNKD